MGQLSLILVIAAFLISGVLLFNANRSAAHADDQVWEHQSGVIARDAASTGMARAVRLLSENLNDNWSMVVSPLNAMANQTYDDGTYTVEAVSDACSILNATSRAKVIARYPGVITARDLIQVRSTGTVPGGGTDRRHQIDACYLQADWNDPIPPAFQYSFISNDAFVFNGGIDVTAYLDGEGNVHSNETMTLGPQVVIDGHATMSSTSGNSVHNNTQIASFGFGPSVPMVAFDPEEFRGANGIPTGGGNLSNDNFRYDAGSVSISNTQTIAPPSGGQREDDPWIWFVDGNLTISGNAHLQLPQWTIIVVTGQLNVQAGANVTVTGQTPTQYCQSVGGSSCTNPSDQMMRDWVNSQLLDGEHAPLAWYVDGDGQRVGAPPPDNDNQIDDVVLGGGGAMVGNIYTNGDFRLSGGGGGMNLVGNVAAIGQILASGGGNGNNFWFLQVGQQNIIPGVLLPGKQIVRIALAEWTTPVLDN